MKHRNIRRHGRKKIRAPQSPPGNSRTIHAVWLLCLLCLCSQLAFAEGKESGPRKAPQALQVLEWENVVLDSVRLDENHLFLNDQVFLITPRARCYDEKDRLISVKKLPAQGTVNLRFVTRPKNEQYPQGGKKKILLEIRVLANSTKKGSSP